MLKEKINNLLKSNIYNDTDDFGNLMASSRFTKRYSIVKECKPYTFGDNIYEVNFCFFFYLNGWLNKTFYCSIKGNGSTLDCEMLSIYEYSCNDVNRADCWEWVDVS